MNDFQEQQETYKSQKEYTIIPMQIIKLITQLYKQINVIFGFSILAETYKSRRAIKFNFYANQLINHRLKLKIILIHCLLKL